MPFRLLAAALLAAATATAAAPPGDLTPIDDAPLVTVARDGVTIRTTAPVQVLYGNGFVRIFWTDTPVPVPPVPPGPVPPSPQPDPPAPPVPPPPPAPIPVPGLRVLVIYETSELSRYPKDQLAALYDQSLRDYMSSVCVRPDPAGVAEWRVFDKDAETPPDSVWHAALKRPRSSLPWIIVSNGKTGFEGPLPQSAQETRALIARYAGTP